MHLLQTFAIVMLAIFLVSIILVLIALNTSSWFQQVFFVYFYEIIATRCLLGPEKPHRARFLAGLKSIKSQGLNCFEKGRVRIMELGPAGGYNFKYYPENTSLICVDPNLKFRKIFDANKSKFPNVELELFINSGAENISEVKDESVDVVVATYVLCSVHDVQKVLQEVKRVLVKGGKYCYMEHIRHSNKWIVVVQRFLSPVWKLIGAGCNLTRNPKEEVEEAGFENVSQYTEEVSSFPSFLKAHLFGVATK